MLRLFSASYQISFSPPGRSFWPCFLCCRFPLLCVRRSLLLLLLLLPLHHIQVPPPTASSSSSTSPPPSASAGQPQKRWLDSREAPILQPRQSRLHRWVTMEHASRLPLPHFQGHFRLCSLVFGIVFFLSVCVCVCVCALVLLLLAALMCAFFM